MRIPAILFALSAPLFANPWLSNLKDAQKKALGVKKDVFIFFSASDWNKRSQEMEKEIFETKEFEQAITKDFVLVNLDFPKNARQDPGSKPKVEIAEFYDLNFLPAVVLTDAGGRPYAMSGYQKVTVDGFLKFVSEQTAKRDKTRAAFAAAVGEKGVAKAQKLIEGIEQIPKYVWRKHYADELAEIKAADPEGKTGFIPKLEQEEAVQKENRHFQQLLSKRSFDQVIKETKEKIAKTNGEEAQRLYMFQIQALAGQKKYADAKAVIETMGKLAPESQHGKSVERYLQIVDRMRARDEKVAADAKKPRKKPAGPIVSKPVAVVSDPKILYDEVAKLSVEFDKATAAHRTKAKALVETEREIARLKAVLADLEKKQPILTKDAKAASAVKDKASQKLAAMKEVVETHEQMERRKKEKAQKKAE